MWSYFTYIVLSIITLWVAANAILYLSKNNQSVAIILHLIGVGILGAFIAALWLQLERPPLRTLAETRIWYAFFIAAIGWVLYQMYRQKWMISYATGMSILFLLITLFKPDSINKTLMPALQSVWFVPHVVVYIFAYAMLGMATVVALYGIYTYKVNKHQYGTLAMVDRLVNLGYAFLTFGLLFGALWAKEAWGHYWTWDPKETWAFISWIGYLVYIHYRFKYRNTAAITNYLIIIVAFLLLLVCWFGVNYLPTAAMSVHTYTG